MTGLLIVAEARPNFMKVASVVEATGRSGFSSALVPPAAPRRRARAFLAELGCQSRTLISA